MLIVSDMFDRMERVRVTRQRHPHSNQIDPSDEEGCVMAEGHSIGISPSVQYRDIPGFPGYRVGDDGSVWTCWRGKSPPYKSSIWRRMKLAPVKKGHLRVGLTRDGVQIRRFVHQLVLEAFVGPCPDGMECRHFPDRDPANNALTNLTWGTKKQNAQDRVTQGTQTRGDSHHCSKVTSAQVIEIRQRCASGEKQRDVAKDMGLTQAAVSLIVRRINWPHI